MVFLTKIVCSWSLFFLLLLVIYGVVTKVPGIFSAFAFPQLCPVVMPKM